MINHANSSEPREMNVHPVPNDQRPQYHHLHGDAPLPPHVRASRVRLFFDENALAKLSRIYENVEYMVSIIESCPPEIKLTLAMLLDIQVDLNDYPQESHPRIRFSTPFMNDRNRDSITSAIECQQKDSILQIYNACPPEQALLALAVAAIKNSAIGMYPPASGKE